LVIHLKIRIVGVFYIFILLVTNFVFFWLLISCVKKYAYYWPILGSRFWNSE
jgi:hypothetical protein